METFELLAFPTVDLSLPLLDPLPIKQGLTSRPSRKDTRLPMQETRVRSLGREDPLEEGMATHSSVLAWRISRPEEPGGLQSMGPPRVGRDLETERQD